MPMQLPLILLLAVGPDAAELEPKVTEVFEDACTTCHDASDDLNMEVAPSQLVGLKSEATGQSLVTPGNLNESYLYLKMLGAEGIEGDPMPLGDDMLPQEQLDAVKDWILALPAGDDVPPPDGGGGDPSSPDPANPGTPEPGPEPEAAPRKGKQPFHGTHQIALHTNTTLGKKTLEFRVHHRFGRIGGPGDRTYLGLAGGVVMSLGMSYGIVDGWDVMARFTNTRLGWELGTKYVPVRQEDGKPLSFGGYASFTALSDFESTSANRFTGNVQGMLSRLWLDRWSTQLNVGYSALTDHQVDPIITQEDGTTRTLSADRRGTVNVGVASTVWLGKKKKHGIDAEYIFPLPIAGGDPDPLYFNGGDTNPNGAKIGSWSLGWSVKTGLHFFQVFLTNTRNIHTNLVAPGGDFGAPITKDGAEFVIGFNLSRRWKL